MRKISTILYRIMFLLIPGLALLLMAFRPFQDGTPPPADPLASIVSIVVQFAALGGVATLVVAVVNLLKYTPLIQDGQSGRWYAGLSLAAFFALIYFHVFKGIDLSFLDAQAAQIAVILVFIGGFLVQLRLGQSSYGILASLKIPLVGASFGQPGSPPALPTEDIKVAPK